MEATTPTNEYLQWQENHNPVKIRLHVRAKAFGCTKPIDHWKTVQGLQYWVERRERQLPDYDSCSDAELATFIIQRKIAIFPETMQGPCSKTKTEVFRARSIEALEAADSAPTFNHFTGLLPELRQRVYEIHLQDFEASVLPIKPPIVLTCRLIRQEALPVLYINHTVTLFYYMDQLSKDEWISATDGVVNAPGETKPPGKKYAKMITTLPHKKTWEPTFHRAAVETPRTKKLLLHMAPEHFQYLRQIKLIVQRRCSGRDKATEVSVTLGKAAQTYQVNIERPVTDLGDANRDSEFESEVMVERRVIEVMDQIAARGGKMKLTPDDCRALKHAITRSWCDYSEWHRKTTGKFAY